MKQLKSTNILGLFNLSGATQDTSIVDNLWFNPTINKLQYSYLIGIWPACGALITGRCRFGGAGTQNPGLVFGGSPGVACTEEYTIGSQIKTL